VHLLVISVFVFYTQYVYQNFIPLIKKLADFKAAITEMYARILWELAADSLGSAANNLGTAGLDALEQQALLLSRLSHRH
jgi:hypothetical protein